MITCIEVQHLINQAQQELEKNTDFLTIRTLARQTLARAACGIS